MAETAREIETHIDRTRERLGSNLRELEDKVEAATDWREHFRERPHLFLGAAFVGGMLVATALRTKPVAQDRTHDEYRRAAGGAGSLHAQGSDLWKHVQASDLWKQAQASDLWKGIQGALWGVASARITEYLGELVPGFDEHYRRAVQGTAAVDSRMTSPGRADG